MPYVTLDWDTGPVGSAQDIILTPRSTVIVVTNTTTQKAAIIAAVEAGDCTIIFETSGQSLTLTSPLVFGSNVQMLCAVGWWRLDVSDSGLASSSGVVLDGVTDIFFGNMYLKTGAGVDTGNNPHSGIEITGACRRIYFLNLHLEYANTGSFSGDSPEGINCWNNDSDPANGPQNITVQRVGTNDVDGHNKTMIIGGVNSTAANQLWVTFFEGYSYSHQRFPLVKSGAKVDMANVVFPNDNNCIHRVLIQDSTTLAVVRQCSIGRTTDTTIPQREEIRDESGNNRAFAPSSGAHANISVANGSGSPIWHDNYTGTVSIPYSLTPAVMDTSYDDIVKARSGLNGGAYTPITYWEDDVEPPPPVGSGPPLLMVSRVS